MRALILASFVVAALAGPVNAQAMAAQSEAYRAFPCRNFVNKPDGKMELLAADQMTSDIQSRNDFPDHFSYCLIVEEVRAECRLDTRFTLGDAVDRLYAKQRNGIALPNKRPCGA